MADEFDDALDGRLVIATDDERMDCIEPANSARIDEKVVKTSSISDTSPHGSKSTDGQAVPSIIVDSCVKADCELVDRANNEIQLGRLVASGLKNPQKSSELVKWEELDGGVVEVPCSPVQKPEVTEQLLQKPDIATKNLFSTSEGISGKISTENHQQQGIHAHNIFNSAGNEPKKVMIDKGTCVFSKSTGAYGLDENLLAMRPGTNLTIDITIICKAGSNTLYISAKWKGREYHGVLTDGEPMFSHSYNQKRNAANNVVDRLAFESGGNVPFGSSSNGSGAISQKAQNSEKNVGLSSGKRGGKRGVGKNGGTGEKRSKNQEGNGGMDEESAILRNSNSTEETNMPASSDCTVKSIALSVPDSAESTPNKPNPFSSDKIPSHFQQTPHHHFLHSSLHQHRRRRTSSSASSARGGLQDTDALAHLRCPHQQCGYRFETINDLNNHLMFGLHGIGDTKAKIYESSATQTVLVQRVSTASDPCFMQDLCTKCQKELFNHDRLKHNKVKQPDRLEDSPNCSKNMKKEADITENSPGSSDLSDDAAPTLEKEESFDKQNDEVKKLQAAKVSSIDALSGTITTIVSGAHSSVQTISEIQPKNDSDSIELPPKNSQALANRQNAQQTQPKAARTLDGFATNISSMTPKTTKKMSTSNVPKTISASLSAESNPYIASTSDLAASANAASVGFSFNPFMPFGPHLTQAFANAMAAQGAAGLGPLPPVPASVSLGPSTSAALSAGLELMMAPSSVAGLLSLGTPLASSGASASTNGATLPSKSAEPPSSQPLHKLYELQQQQFAGSGTVGRAASTKPSTSGHSHLLSMSGGSQQGVGRGANASPAAADLALMRPNSTISAVGHQQQQMTTQQSYMAQQQLLRHCPAAPSPLESSSSLSANVSQQLPPVIPHPFFPSTNPPNLLAAAVQQQQMVATIRRTMANQQLTMSGGATSSSSSVAQQQAVQAAQPPHPGMPPSFFPQGLSPGVLAAAAASNFDLNNALQNYAAILASSAPPINAETLPTGQQQPNQK